MQPYIEVRFYRRAHDPSLASTVNRWVARFESMRFEVQRVAVAIESGDRAQTNVGMTLTLTNGRVSSAATSHADPYVAISDAFRMARRQLLERVGSAAAGMTG